MSAIKGLEPCKLWQHFESICRIPHCSGNEQRVLDYIIEVANRHGLSYRQDRAGNVVVLKPPHPDCKVAPVIVLQAHVDMVCEKNQGVEFDFAKDPIEIVRNGDFLYAERTTLGADNGIGVAAMLAVLEDKGLVHGPLELLFTVDEETGLNGARELEPSLFSGRLLLNLDGEGARLLLIGCSGGGTSEVELPMHWNDEVEGQAYRITVSGLKGGHSGIDIHLERGNAVKFLARLLWKAKQVYPIRIAAFAGGDKHNAIPREATAVVVIPNQASEELLAQLERESKALREEYAVREPDLAVRFAPELVHGSRAATAETSARLIDLASALPHGIMRWSAEMEGLVETSVTLAKATLTESARFVLSTRSSRNSQLETVRDQVEAIATLAGAQVSRNESYPGWQPNLQSPLLALMKEACRDLWGENPRVEAVHAGLEPGIIGQKCPGMDMISFGPEIRHPHSPDECVHIPSVPEFWALLLRTLEKVGGTTGI